jgi:hypothetical protein
MISLRVDFEMDYCCCVAHQCNRTLVEKAQVKGTPLNEAHKQWYHLKSLEDFTRGSEEGRHSLLVHELYLFIVFFICASCFFFCCIPFPPISLDKNKNHHHSLLYVVD